MKLFVLRLHGKKSCTLNFKATQKNFKYRIILWAKNSKESPIVTKHPLISHLNKANYDRLITKKGVVLFFYDFTLEKITASYLRYSL